MNNKPLVIIPAAGWGTRVGSPPAKELLSHPIYPHRNFIEQALHVCDQAELDALFISRADKSALNDWLLKNIPANNYLIIEQTTEWTDSLLQSQPLWRSKNILLLPDTQWRPLNAMDQLIQSLDNHQVGILLHQVTDPTQWGMVSLDFMIEKPQSLEVQYLGAWGIVGFTNHPKVYEFWQNYHCSRREQQPAYLPGPAWIGHLDYFEDLTRGPLK